MGMEIGKIDQRGRIIIRVKLIANKGQVRQTVPSFLRKFFGIKHGMYAVYIIDPKTKKISLVYKK